MSILLGKISKVKFGLGGYQECMFGLSLEFTSGSIGVGKFIGTWDVSLMPHTKDCKWTEKERITGHDTLIREVSKLLNEAKITDVMHLIGKPVELTVEFNTLKSWRILTEVL